MNQYDTYKPSGIDWIGDIPEHWEVKKLKYLASLKSGESITSDSIKDTGDYPVFGGNGLRGYTSAYTHEGSYILIGRQGALCGNINYAKGQFWASEHAVIVTLSGGVNFIWLGELLRAMDLNQYSVAAAQPGLAVDRIQTLTVPVPSFKEQQKIAHYLDEKTAQLDTLIDRKRRLITLLREEKTALINEAVTKGINPDVPMKDSGIEWLGEVPAHWEVKKLKFIAETISKGTTPSTEGREILPEGEVRFIKAENIQEGRLHNEPAFFIDEATNEVIKRSKLRARDILIVIAGATIGKIAIMESTFLPANTNQAVCFIRPKQEEIERFIWYWLQSSFIYENIWLEAVQSAQPNLSMERIGNFVIPSPNAIEQAEVVVHLDRETTKIDHTVTRIEREIELMQEYRTALISEVVTGKVKVV